MKIIVMQSSPIHSSLALLKLINALQRPLLKKTSAYIPPSV
jgi:hypothetical protein